MPSREELTGIFAKVDSGEALSYVDGIKLAAYVRELVEANSRLIAAMRTESIVVGVLAFDRLLVMDRIIAKFPQEETHDTPT